MDEQEQPTPSEELNAVLQEIRRRLGTLEEDVQCLRKEVRVQRAPVVPPPMPWAPVATPGKPAERSPAWQPARLTEADQTAGPAPAAEAPAPAAEAPAPAAWPALPARPPEAQVGKPLPQSSEAQVAELVPQRARNFEQIIGTRWMLFASVAVLIVAGVYTFKLAYDMGWITPMRRLIGGTIFSLLMIGGGQWALRRRMRLFAAGLIGVGIVWLYQVVYVASPNGFMEDLRILNTEWAFALMCVVTAMGMALAVQTRMLTCAIISLVGAMATPMLLSTGVNREVFLMCYLLAVNAGFLSLALAKRWQALAPLAMTGTVIIFVGWFWKFYGRDAMSITTLFAWLLVGLHIVYALAGEVFNRANRFLTGTMIFVGAGLLAAFLLATCTQIADRHAFAVQLFAVAAGAYGYSLWRDNRAGAMIVFAAAMVMLWRWFIGYFQPEATAACCAYAWVLALLPARALFLAGRERWKDANIFQLALAGAAMTLGWLAMGRELPASWLAVQLLALNVMVLGVCLWRRWNYLRAGVVVWTALALLLQFLVLNSQWPSPWKLGLDFAVVKDSRWDMTWFTCSWAWVFYALVMADVLVRAWKTALKTIEHLDAGLTCLATSAMFAGTYVLLNPAHHSWMGLYTTGVAAAIVVLVWAVHRHARRPALASSFLVQALALFAVAAPIQFDRSEVTIAWIAQGVAAMAIASRLKNRILLIFSPMVLGAALIHYLAWEEASDEVMRQIAFTWLGVAVTKGLLLGVALAAGLFAAAALLRAGKAILADRHDRAVGVALVLAAALLFAVRTVCGLPAIGATWWWMAMAAGLATVGLWRRSGWLSGLTAAVLAAGAVKWALYDTLLCRVGGPWDLTRTLVLNWQFAAGAALAVCLLAYLKLPRDRSLNLPAGVRTAIFVTGAVLVCWGGSFEIDRFFHAPGAPGWADAYQSTQMGLSIWWGIYAAALLTLGFKLRRAVLRYMAIAIFAITIGKVFLMDLDRIQMVWRVLSLMGLGLMLLAGSLLYSRQFRSKT